MIVWKNRSIDIISDFYQMIPIKAKSMPHPIHGRGNQGQLYKRIEQYEDRKIKPFGGNSSF